jgi:CheY-like chemotaxis protein
MALAVARTFRPNVVLSEIRLPEIDGYDLARCLQAELRDVVLIAVTTCGQQADRLRASQAGFGHHFVKPADPSDIHDLLEIVSRRRRR